MGHGNMPPATIRKNDRIRHGIERLLPNVRQQNNEYYENIERDMPQLVDERLGWAHNSLRTKYGLAVGDSARISLLGYGSSGAPRGFRFSDITAYISTYPTKEDGTGIDQADWLLFITNQYNTTTSLIEVETDFIPQRDHIVNARMVDTKTGFQYAVGQYDLERRAGAAKTIHHIFDMLSFSLAHDTDGITVDRIE